MILGFYKVQTLKSILNTYLRPLEFTTFFRGRDPGPHPPTFWGSYPPDHGVALPQINFLATPLILITQQYGVFTALTSVAW